MVIVLLSEFLRQNKNARRIFGNKELEIIFKQLEGLPLKQSEKNRLSRDIKPKLEFIKEIAQFKDEFKLEKNQNNKRLMCRYLIYCRKKLKSRLQEITKFFIKVMITTT